MNTLKLVTLQYLMFHLTLKVIIYIQLPALYQIIINQKSLNLQCTFNADISLANIETKHYEKFKSPLTQTTLDITDIVLSFMGDRS